MVTKMVSHVHQLIRMADVAGIDTIACGNRECEGQLFRFKIFDGAGHLLCYGCGREAVTFHLETLEPEAN